MSGTPINPLRAHLRSHLRRWRHMAPALGLGLSLFLLETPAFAQETRHFGIFIGQNEGGRNTRRLLYAEEDARRVEEVLLRLGSIQARDASLLLSTSRSQVLATIRRVGGQVQEARASGARTALTFYYSGHADIDGLHLGTTRLAIDELKAALRSSGADVRLVLLDACQSGRATLDGGGESVASRASGEGVRQKGGVRAPTFLVDLDEGDHLSGEAVITSSAADEASQESDRVGGGYFTHHLVAGLLGAADSSRDGQVTLDEVYNYAYHHTLFETADSAGGLQHPSLQTQLHGYGQLVLTRPDRAQTVLVFPMGLEGHYLVFDRDRKRLVAELQLSPTEEKRLSLPAGRYLVQKRASDHLLTTEVMLTRGTLKQLEPDAMVRSTFDADFSRGVSAANLERALGPRLSLSATLGYQSFWFQPEEGLYPSLPMMGGELAWRPRWLEDWAFTGDLALGQGSRVLTEVYALDVDYTELRTGLGLRYFLSSQGVIPQRMMLSLGPHLELLAVTRRFPGTREAPEHSYTTSPGLVLDAALNLSRGFSVALQARGHYLLYQEGDAQLSMGHAELMFRTSLNF